MYQQVLDPVGDSLGLSTIFAALPLVVLFVLLGGFRLKAHVAAPVALALSLVVAIVVYDMPAGQALLAGSEGAVFGLFPVMWIVFGALWIYNMTEATGHFATLRRSFGAISDDQRVQAVIVAFCFGALLEALAGFGTPVAITAVMLVAVGFTPMKAAAVALVANTAPVAFGAIAIPIVTLAGITEIPKEDIADVVGRQAPVLALFVPLILVFMVDGARGVRQAWPAAIAGGFAFAVAQFLCSNFFSVELTDIVASLAGAGAIVLLTRVWSPAQPAGAATGRRASRGSGPAIAGAAIADPVLEAEVRRRRDDHTDSRAEVWTAYAPYLIVIAVFSVAQIGPVKTALGDAGTTFGWPGLHVRTPGGEELSSTTFNLNWANAAGSLLLVAGLLSMPFLRIGPWRGVRLWARTFRNLRWATLTVLSVLSLAYVMNASAQTVTIGAWIAGAGGVVALLSPFIGWFGVAVTGSDTSSNALFGALQVQAAKDAGLDQVLLVSANTSGGVLGKMVSPQNLAIGAAAVGLGGREGDLLRKVLGWSVAMLAFMCVLVYLQTTPVLSWMLP
jgi:lactate permease